MMFYKETIFKETPIGKIPKEWEAVKLSDISESFISGGTPSTKEPKYWNGNIPWIRSIHLSKYYINENSIEQYITKEGLENSASNIVPKGNLIIATRVGIGKSAVNLIDVAINQDLTGVVIDKLRAEPFYVVWYLLSPKTIRTLESFTRGTTIKGMAQDHIKNLLIPLPSLSEQQKIAEVLSTVDEAIQKTDEVIAKTERLKKGLMQELLTRGIGHKEFKDTEIGRIPKEWEIVTLGGIATEVYRYPTYYNIEYVIKGIPEIRGELIKENGELEADVSKYRFISEEISRRYPRTILQEGDFVLSVRGTMGKVAIVPKFLEGANITANLIRISLDRSKCYPPFFKQVFLSDFFKRTLNDLSSQTTIKTIQAPILKSLKIPLPPIKEQQKIAEILSTIDKKLEIERNEKAKLERIKQGLMDLLLTGKIRVKVN
jgi:type I restriction enzyme S subunit